jgi:hypothetical protein
MNAADASLRARAEPHKPRTPEGICDAAGELLRQGLTEHDIAHVFCLDVAQIRQLLGERDAGGQQAESLNMSQLEKPRRINKEGLMFRESLPSTLADTSEPKP